MQKLLKDYLDEIGRKQRKRRRAGIAAALVAVMVVGTVIWSLAQAGIAMTGEPKCGLEEHEHSDACYEDAIICGMEESAGHTHTEECYQTPEPTLICGQEESEEHTHTEECYQTAEPVLICGQEESEGHTHTDACHGRQLICGKEEHKHTDECFIDKSADVEDASVWDAQYADTEWKEGWGENLVIAAGKQIGYKESEKNYTIAEDGSHKGYTRYGQFAVNAGTEGADVYADWDAAFVNFCIHYAGLEESQMFPNKVKTSEWHEEFITVGEGMNTVYLTAPEGYEPQAGDIIFFNKENEETETQMGIVSSYDKEKNEIKVIEGNSANEVKENKYDLNSNDTHITEYLKISEMEEAYKNRNAEPSEEVTEESAAGEEPEETSDIRTMTAEGPDYTVTVSFTEEAGIPEDAVLDVREIEQDSEEYQEYYEQSLEAAATDDLRFARYFDITFLVNGEKIEPKASVEVKISYLDDMAIDEDSSNTVIHFADSGTEVLDTDVDLEEKSFKFTQESFSVSGTVASDEKVLYYETNVDTIDELNGEKFLITNNTSSNLILSSNQNGLKGVQFDGETTVLTTATAWEFEQDQNSSYKLYDSKNQQYLSLENGELSTSDSGTAFTVQTTDGKIQLSAADDGYVTSYASKTSSGWKEENQAESLTLYTADQARAAYSHIVLNPYNIGIDGQMTYAYSFNVDGQQVTKAGKNTKRMQIAVASNGAGTAQITLPNDTERTEGFYVNDIDEANRRSKHKITDVGDLNYHWVLDGWYNIATGEYFPVTGDKESRTIIVDLNRANVFYAHWVASDEALNNGSLTGAKTTPALAGLIKIHMFDYDEFFNLSQLEVTQNGLTSENWRGKNNDNDPFTFYSTRSSGDKNNGYSGLAGVANGNTTYAKGKLQNNLDTLFSKDNTTLGVRYLGEADNLFSYDSSTGYYSYDSGYGSGSDRNGDGDTALYNKKDKRFYVYEGSQIWRKSTKGETERIFLPLNKAGNDYGDGPDQEDNRWGTTNYWFGMETEVQFWLSDKVEEGQSSSVNQNKNADMKFEFSGDDDVLVYVDDELVLDLSGIHAKWTGTINFSTGSRNVYENGTYNSKGFSAGTHTLKVYYLERGRGGSNCSIKFNLLPIWNYNAETYQAVTVEKEWKHSDGTTIEADEIKDLSIDAILSDETGLSKRETLNTTNEWKKTWPYLDEGKTYTIKEDTSGDVQKSYTSKVSSGDAVSGDAYWLERSDLSDGDIIIIGNGKTAVLTAQENHLLGTATATYDLSGDVLKEIPKTVLQETVNIDDITRSQWKVHKVATEKKTRDESGEEAVHFEFKLESVKEPGWYLNIKETIGEGTNKQAGNAKLVNSFDEASILHFSEKGNLTGQSENRLVCDNGNGFMLVTKDQTKNDQVEAGGGKGSARRVHVYRSVPIQHTKYTITNTRREADVEIHKYNSKNESLEGAEFRLYKLVDGVKKYIGDSLITNTNGIVQIKQLSIGTYYLEETKAPTGYQRLKNDIEITISEIQDKNVKYSIKNDNTFGNTVTDQNVTNGVIPVDVQNSMLYSLPETGGSGIYLYMFSGVLLMAVAVLMTYKNKQRRKGVLRS